MLNTILYRIVHMSFFVGFILLVSASANELPVGKAPPAIKTEHFPDRLHTFVWKNWESVRVEQIAKVLNTTPANVYAIAQSMGLEPQPTITDQQLQRSYISVIRRNWHLLPYDQLLTLLDWNADQLAYTLREDDFLWAKLGYLKPDCSPLSYVQPDESVKRRCAEIKAIVSSHFGESLAKSAQPRFDFVRDLSKVNIENTLTGLRGNGDSIRFIYSYFAVYGDPLLNPELDPYPDGLLQRLSELGVNGVWLHTVLRQLAPSKVFHEFGAGHETRLANLGKLVKRAKRYGIKVYLYMNEPRAMKAPFFEQRKNMQGVQEGDYFAMCTSGPEVRQWISEALSFVFKSVPDLGGVFTITASENLTNCYSHTRQPACPRCAKRSGPEVIAEVNAAIAEGVRRGNPNAKVIVWDWGWREEWADAIINALPDNVYLMSVSEWSKPIVRGGIASEVGEYSISAVGPGPRAQKHWSLARKRGLKTIAKVQANCTWELSAVPYLPVMNLVAQHCENLSKIGVDGLMLSWTVGGYPSPNLQVAKKFQGQTVPTVEQALRQVATERYGPAAVPDALHAWAVFSETFAEYPFHQRYIYVGPTQWGPANMLFPTPTGYKATMVGFPYDDVDGWRAIYPADVLADQFEKMAEGFKNGLAIFEKALDKASTEAQRENATDDLRIAEAAYLHFKSVANQVRFTLARNALLAGSLDPNERKTHLTMIKSVATEEIDIAKRLFALTCEDSRIGFEASNHYYYYPLDLVEKVINCTYILNNVDFRSLN